MIKHGDTIGILALAGVCEEHLVKQAVLNIESLGFKVRLSKNIYDKNRYLAGSDESKLEALYEFFQDQEIKLILNARGGYGSIRLINKIDYKIIKNNPKPFCGFSDITAMLLMFYKNAGIITYHGPMACSDFVQINNFTQNSFFKALNNEHLEFTGTKIYKAGCAEGILWGGNLATVVSLCGQDFIPDEDFIFFTEDLNEPAYKIDRYLTQLFFDKNFKKNLVGIVLGDFANIDDKTLFDNIFYELGEKLNIPIMSGLKIGHVDEQITVPLGIVVNYDTETKRIFEV